MIFKSLAAVALLAAGGSAQAATVFADSFDSEAPRLAETTALAAWAVTGAVDVLQGGTSGVACDGNCIDLDGGGNIGLLQSLYISFNSGGRVRISFDLSGSQRSTDRDSFAFLLAFSQPTDIAGGRQDLPGTGSRSFGPLAGVISFVDSVQIAGTTGWRRHFYEFQPLEATEIRVAFQSSGSDGIGPLIDNVQISHSFGVVPEPATWAMLMAGFGMIGAAARRRSRAARA